MGPVSNLMFGVSCARSSPGTGKSLSGLSHVPAAQARQPGGPAVARNRSSHLVRSFQGTEPVVPGLTQPAPGRTRVGTASSTTPPPVPRVREPAERVTDQARAVRRSVTASTISVPR